MIIPSVFWLVPVASVVALAMAYFFFSQMMKADEGTPRMKEIFMSYVLNVQNPWVPFAFLTGGLFSGLAGFFGMKTATYASARTANAARNSLDSGLKVAFD